MKRKHTKIRSVTFFLAICVSVFSASFCLWLMAAEYQSARDTLDTYNRQFEAWQACQQTKPAYYKANTEAVAACIKSLNEARANFWVKLPKRKLAASFALVGLGSAIAGYLATWILLWGTGLCIYKLVTGLASCFRRKPKKTALSTAEGTETDSPDTRHASQDSNMGDESPADAGSGPFSPRDEWGPHPHATWQSHRQVKTDH